MSSLPVTTSGLSADASSPGLPCAQSGRPVRRPHPGEHYFWFGQAVFFLAVAVIGFAPSYVDEAKGTFAISALAHVHGALMASWLLLFVVQTGLALRGAMNWHRTLGFASVGLAAAMWISMAAVSVTFLLRTKPEVDSVMYDMLYLQLESLAIFPLFYVWGVRVRRNAAAHKRLMTFATLMFLGAALDRIQWLPYPPLPGYWPMAVRLYPIMIPLYVFDWVTLKRIHPITLVGTGVMMAVHAVASLLWGLPAWHKFVHALVTSR